MHVREFALGHCEMMWLMVLSVRRDHTLDRHAALVEIIPHFGVDSFIGTS
jgi:hypothetical protein